MLEWLDSAVCKGCVRAQRGERRTENGEHVLDESISKYLTPVPQWLVGQQKAVGIGRCTRRAVGTFEPTSAARSPRARPRVRPSVRVRVPPCVSKNRGFFGALSACAARAPSTLLAAAAPAATTPRRVSGVTARALAATTTSNSRRVRSICRKNRSSRDLRRRARAREASRRLSRAAIAGRQPNQPRREEQRPPIGDALHRTPSRSRVTKETEEASTSCRRLLAVLGRLA